MHLFNCCSWWVVDNTGVCSYLSHTYPLTLIEDTPPFVDICLVVNLIFLHLPACSTSFHEAFIFGLSFIVNSFHSIEILISYCEIFSCVVLTSRSFSLGFSSTSYFHCRWSWHISKARFTQLLHAIRTSLLLLVRRIFEAVIWTCKP